MSKFDLKKFIKEQRENKENENNILSEIDIPYELDEMPPRWLIRKVEHLWNDGRQDLAWAKILQWVGKHYKPRN